jgi:pullulanase
MNTFIVYRMVQNHWLVLFCLFLFLGNTVGSIGMSLATRHFTAKDLDSYASSQTLGCHVDIKAKRTTFRLFAPRSSMVKLHLFASHDERTARIVVMKRDSDGVWEVDIPEILFGSYYAYSVSAPPADQILPKDAFNEQILIGDPYSKAVVTKNTYRHEARTLIIDTSFDWGNDTWVAPKNVNDLVIYEAHLRDMTAHISSGVKQRGTYRGMTENGTTGGINHLKALGVNAVEFLPLHEFANIELPYKDSSTIQSNGLYNTWNQYARNHWGYMTSYFFAPDSYYASDGSVSHGGYSGIKGAAVREMKQMVKDFHKAGIAVLMDVVFNHVSNYDYNPFKLIDKHYYFHTLTNGEYRSDSYCGNDFKTERPMARRMIVDCIKYWMTEYHIDGFRFDLATMIDWETCKEIIKEARKINPHVIIIAEAWGGNKYDLRGFSDIDWASWNDLIRNGVKGQNPFDGQGFIFGKFQGTNSQASLRNFVLGSLRDEGGAYRKKEHSISYLESHDDNTMGDFIRLALGEIRNGEPVRDRDAHARLSPLSLALNKLAAMFLMTVQGPVMIHEGQEFARSKVIAPTGLPDVKVATIDHNSYDKDDETNYINYRHVAMNQELVAYYQGLIGLRKLYPKAFGSAEKKDIVFHDTESPLVVAWTVNNQGGKKGTTLQPKQFLVILNGNRQTHTTFVLPKGKWRIVGSAQEVSPILSGVSIEGTVSIPHSSGMILAQ